MIKGLKALESLFGNNVFISIGRMLGKAQITNEINIIQKELKALEKIQKACEKYPELRATIGIACASDLNLVLEVLDND